MSKESIHLSFSQRKLLKILGPISLTKNFNSFFNIVFFVVNKALVFYYKESSIKFFSSNYSNFGEVMIEHVKQSFGSFLN